MKKATNKTPLYRTVLGIAVAAILAATLPFTALYVSAASNHSVVVSKSGHAVVVTKTSGGQTLVSTGGGTTAKQQAPAVTTRTS